jgi:hypothetical protein
VLVNIKHGITFISYLVSHFKQIIKSAFVTLLLYLHVADFFFAFGADMQ